MCHPGAVSLNFLPAINVKYLKEGGQVTIYLDVFIVESDLKIRQREEQQTCC